MSIAQSNGGSMPNKGLVDLYGAVDLYLVVINGGPVDLYFVLINGGPVDLYFVSCHVRRDFSVLQCKRRTYEGGNRKNKYR